MILKTKRLVLSSPKLVNPNALLDYYIRNKDFLKEFEPIKPEEYFTISYQKELLESQYQDWKIGKTYKFYISAMENPEIIIGFISLSNIIRGAFCSCFLGYQLDNDYLNLGFMTESVNKIVDFAFNNLFLHRIEGNVMPKNIPSIKVLEKCGFTNEGVSKSYLKINDLWEDHIHFVKLNHNLK